MVYLPKKRGVRALGGCGCSAGALGCAECGGRCGGMQGLGFAVGEPAPGATATVQVTEMLNTPAAKLQQQVNRFAGDSVPAALRFRQTPLPVNGVLDVATAMAAVLIAQKRAIDATIRYNADNATKAVLQGATTALADPLPYVTKNLDLFLTIVSNYADMKGLPGASTSILAPVDKLKIALMVGGVVGLYLLSQRGGRRRSRATRRA